MGDTTTAPTRSPTVKRVLRIAVTLGVVLTLVALGAGAACEHLRCGSLRGRARLAGAGGTADTPPAPLDHDHSALTSLLERFVQEGDVDYTGLRSDGQDELDAYLRSLESVTRETYDEWSRDERLAFWINAYNAHTIALVLDHWPIRSIREIGVLPFAAFREEFIPLRWFRGGDLSLNAIEHEILRADFGEPRIHFALVCASRGCPKLRSEAYRAADLERQLEDQVRDFLADTSKARFDEETGTLYLSPIFSWFGEDFESAEGSVVAFVRGHADGSLGEALGGWDDDVPVEFLDYDWSLNGR